MNTSCVIRLSALGDVVLTSGVLLYWQKTRNMAFHCITRKAFAPVFMNHPAVQSVYALHPEDIQNWMTTSFQLRREFSGHRLIDLHSNLRSRILGLFWKKNVVSYPKFNTLRRLYRLTHSRWAGNKLCSLNVPQRYSLALEEDPPPPEMVRPRIFLSEAEITEAKFLLAGHGISPPFVALHPYATHPGKSWPQSSWLDLIQLLEKQSISWIVLGRSDRPLLDPGKNAKDFTNLTELRQTCAILQLASCAVSNDSGPTHLATAVKTPVLALFGPTSKEWGFFPSGDRDFVLSSRLSCSPCTLHGKIKCRRDYECMKSIPPSHALDWILRLVK